MQAGEIDQFLSVSFCFHILETVIAFPTSSEDFSIALPSVFSWEMWWNRRSIPTLFWHLLLDISTLLHLRALSHLHLDPSHKCSSLAMLNVPLPYSSASLSAALFKVSLLAAGLASLSHPLPPWILCTGQWSLMASWTDCTGHCAVFGDLHS